MHYQVEALREQQSAVRKAIRTALGSDLLCMDIETLAKTIDADMGATRRAVAAAGGQ